LGCPKIGTTPNKKLQDAILELLALIYFGSIEVPFLASASSKLEVRTKNKERSA
jgi:hypothetical protein